MTTPTSPPPSDFVVGLDGTDFIAMGWCYGCGSVEYHDLRIGKKSLGFMVYRCNECPTQVHVTWDWVARTWKRTEIWPD